MLVAGKYDYKSCDVIYTIIQDALPEVANFDAREVKLRFSRKFAQHGFCCKPAEDRQEL